MTIEQDRINLSLGDFLAPQENGCVCDGMTDDSPALSALGLDVRDIQLNGGTLRIASDVEIHGRLTVAHGATILIDGCTLTLHNTFTADPYTVFACVNGGDVTISSTKTVACYAEWFGATADGVTDCTTAINLAYQAHPRVQLFSGTYLAHGLHLNRTGHEIRGLGRHDGTMISSASGTGDIIQIGNMGASSTSNGTDYLDSIALRDIYVQRTVSCFDPGVGYEPSGPCNIRTYGAVRCELDNVFIQGGFIGLLLGATTNTFSSRCYAAYAVPDDARYFGVWIDGKGTAEGHQSSNASTRISDFLVSAPPAPLDEAPKQNGTSTAFYIDGGFSDQFLWRGESGNCSVGMRVVGSPSSTDRRVVDLNISGFKHDVYRDTGVILQDFYGYGVVGIDGGYIAPVPDATGPMMSIENAGVVSIAGDFQFIGSYKTDAVGISVSNVQSLTVAPSVKMQDVFSPIEIRGLVTGSIMPTISNTDARSSGQAAITASALGFVTLEPQISAEVAGAFAFAVDVIDAGTGSINFTADVSNVNAGNVGALVRLASTVAASNALVAGGTVRGIVDGGLVIGGYPPTAGKLSVRSASGGVSFAVSDNVNSSLYVDHATAGLVTLRGDAGNYLKLAFDALNFSSVPSSPLGAGYVYKDSNGFLKIG